MSDRAAIDSMLDRGDRKEWRGFLDGATMQQATLACVRASAVGIDDMRELAFKRMEHLNGEHRHPDLWP